MDMQFSFVSAEDANVCRFIASIEQETSEDVLHYSFLLKFDRRSRSWGKFQLPWEVGSLITRVLPVREVVVMNPDGAIGRGHGDFRQESVSGAVGPAELGPVREVRAVGNGLICVGMGRQCYMWMEGRSWSAIHTQEMLHRQSPLEVTGFNSVHGISPTHFWVVGMNGEIWRHLEGNWERFDSPTNLALHRIRVLSDGRQIAVGQSGIVLVGEYGGWREALCLDADDVWDVCPYGDSIYVTTTEGLYKLSQDLESVELVPVDGVETFGHLDTAGGVLWSSGAGDLAFTVDGRRWEVITPR